MNIDQFWELIEASKPANGDYAEQANALQKLLEPLELSEIRSFQKHFWELLDESYRWDLWDVAAIIEGGFCSDDGFDYFRAWLIGQGREYFEAALQQPERAADRAERRKVENEWIMYAAGKAYEAKTGEWIPLDDFHPTLIPAGNRLSKTEFEQSYPELRKRFPKSEYYPDLTIRLHSDEIEA